MTIIPSIASEWYSAPPDATHFGPDYENEDADIYWSEAWYKLDAGEWYFCCCSDYEEGEEAEWVNEKKEIGNEPQAYTIPGYLIPRPISTPSHTGNDPENW